MIKLKPDVNPYTLFTARNVPIPQCDKVRDELENGSDCQSHSTNLVVCRYGGRTKSSGAVKICVDLRPFNESVLRKPYSVPTVDETLAQLSRATVFSKVDANSGFWKIPLSEDSQQYTTFMSHYCFKKLPFGIASTPELVQLRISAILQGLDGVLCHMDDVLVF